MILALADGVIIALVVACTTTAGTVAPVILAHVMNKANRRSKQLDWDRQDLVAQRIEEATAAAAEAARKQQETQAAIVIGQRAAVEKLVVVEEQNKVIHALVNSSYTLALEAQLVALEGQLVLSREIAVLRSSPATEDETATLQALEHKVVNLRSVIADRKHQQELIEAQVAADHRPPDEEGHPNRRRGDRRVATELPPPPPLEIEVPQTFTAEVTLKPQEHE